MENGQLLLSGKLHETGTVVRNWLFQFAERKDKYVLCSGIRVSLHEINARKMSEIRLRAEKKVRKGVKKLCGCLQFA
jgi:hypothetical protein